MQFTLTSTTTAMGNRAHSITTKANQFALALFEQALDMDVEPDFAITKGFYVVEFIATDADCADAIRHAQGAASC